MAVSNHPMAACDPHSDDAGKQCGSSFAFPYFIAFYVLCSFLVSSSCAAIIIQFFAVYRIEIPKNRIADSRIRVTVTYVDSTVSNEIKFTFV